MKTNERREIFVKRNNARGKAKVRIAKQCITIPSNERQSTNIDGLQPVSLICIRLYSFCEDLYKKSIILIANDSSWISKLDDRVRSRLVPEVLEFKPYNAAETEGIMRKRASYAFVPDVWESKAIQNIIDKTIEMRDIRSGLFLLREAGNYAEMKSSRKIKLEHAENALSKLEGFKIKSFSEFGEDEQKILGLVKKNSGKTVKELHDLCSGDFSYRNFHRKIDDLRKNKMIEVEEVPGRSSIINYSKKLTEF